MGDALSLHLEVLEPGQLRVLRSTGRMFTEGGFRLGGGTGLALLIGHRQSLDFDWFRIDSMGDPMLLAREVRDAGAPLEVDQVARGTLHGRVEGVRVSLLEFSYPDLAEPLRFPEHGVAILSLDDLAAMKLSAIAQRGSRKDFVDLFALCTRHRPLTELIELYQEKFEVQETGHLLYSLAYFDDAEAERMPRMLWDTTWPEMRERLEGWVRDLAKG